MRIDFIESILSLTEIDWNALCKDEYPFTRYAFLAALETSGSVGKLTGWKPQHLVVYDNGELIAAMPLYIKSHSYGEYVFDWVWADAYQRYGLNYYPKLICAIPFTPCTGSRLLIKNPAEQASLFPKIIAAIKHHTEKLKASGWHCLFPPKDFSDMLCAENFSQRLATQFHWFNRDYTCWNDFVASMNSRKRKNINKERRAVAEQGITFTIKSASDIKTDDWKLFYQLYCNTYLKRSGHLGYLTEDFFIALQNSFAQHSVMVIASHLKEEQEQPIAAALFFKDKHTLYGRYWGCVAEYDFLHFETCYYQGIEYAIKQGLQKFDGGAQGEHKIQRGFEPILTYSNHWLVREDFQEAIDKFLAAEKLSILNYQQDAKNYLPFKESHFTQDDSP